MSDELHTTNARHRAAIRRRALPDVTTMDLGRWIDTHDPRDAMEQPSNNFLAEVRKTLNPINLRGSKMPIWDSGVCPICGKPSCPVRYV